MKVYYGCLSTASTAWRSNLAWGRIAMCIRPSLLATGVVVVLSSLFISNSFTFTASAQQAQPAGGSQVGVYSGPGGCAASNCHGSVSAKTVTRVWQNEYSIWAAQDKHARAYNMLSNPVSMRMGKILKLG